MGGPAGERRCEPLAGFSPPPWDDGGQAPTHPQLVSRRLSPTCRDAMPKSAMRMLFFSSKSRFSGFRSLWLRQAGRAQASALLLEAEAPFAISQRHF